MKYALNSDLTLFLIVQCPDNKALSLVPDALCGRDIPQVGRANLDLLYRILLFQSNLITTQVHSTRFEFPDGIDQVIKAFPLGCGCTDFGGSQLISEGFCSNVLVIGFSSGQGERERAKRHKIKVKTRIF